MTLWEYLLQWWRAECERWFPPKPVRWSRHVGGDVVFNLELARDWPETFTVDRDGNLHRVTE